MTCLLRKNTMVQIIKLLVETGDKDSKQSHDVTQGNGDKGQPTRVKAVKNAQYKFEDPQNKNRGPLNLTTKRVGRSLHVLLDGSKEADLIVEDYYDDAVAKQDRGGLYGRAEDGRLYEYIPEDAKANNLVAALQDGGAATSQVLGYSQAADIGLAAVPVAAGFSWLTVAASLIGAAALGGKAGGSSSSSSTTNNNSTNNNTTAPSGQTGALDDASDSGVKGDNITNVNRPTVSGKATAGATVEVIVKDDQGNTVGTYSTKADSNGNYTVVVGPAVDWPMANTPNKSKSPTRQAAAPPTALRLKLTPHHPMRWQPLRKSKTTRAWFKVQSPMAVALTIPSWWSKVRSQHRSAVVKPYAFTTAAHS